MPLEIVRNDITLMKVDAIVNAANSKLEEGGGVCGAIFAAAGAESLRAECARIGYCETGAAVLTDGFALPASYIIHTVGPVWQGGGHGEEEQLRACYTSSLQLAHERGLSSIAFPLISSGLYGYPKDKALAAAIAAIGEFLLVHEMTVYLVVYDRAAFRLSERLFSALTTYIDDRYVDARQSLRKRSELERERKPGRSDGFFGRAASAPLAEQPPAPMAEQSLPLPAAAAVGKAPQSLEEALERLEMSFSQALLKLIDERGKTDVEVYKRANIDRKLFSKIRNATDYKPSKATAIAFAIALELDRGEIGDLLGRAGYALSRSSKFDLIIEFFVHEGNYNIFEINEALFAFEQDLLGG